MLYVTHADKMDFRPAGCSASWSNVRRLSGVIMQRARVVGRSSLSEGVSEGLLVGGRWSVLDILITAH